MFLMSLTFVLTTALYGALLWLAWRRLSRHMQGNPEAVQALVEHVLMPLFGTKKKEEP